MPRKPEKPRMPDGAILKANLRRLGFTEEVVKSAEIVRQVEQRTGRQITRQRIAALTNAIHIEPTTIEWLAKGLGTTAKDLMREPEA